MKTYTAELIMNTGKTKTTLVKGEDADKAMAQVLIDEDKITDTHLITSVDNYVYSYVVKNCPIRAIKLIADHGRRYHDHTAQSIFK